MVEELIDARAGERILDAGCGAGFYTKRLAGAGARVTGLDAARAMVDAARRDGLEARVADLERDDPGGPYDKVLCAGALEFAGNPARVVSRLAAALRPGAGGRLVLLYPPAGALGLLYRLFHRSHGVRARTFSEREVEAMLEGAGLRVAARRRSLLSAAAMARRP